MCYLPGFLAVSPEELLRGGVRRLQVGAGAGAGWVRGAAGGCPCVRAVLLAHPTPRFASGQQLSASQGGGGSEQRAGMNTEL